MLEWPAQGFAARSEWRWAMLVLTAEVQSSCRNGRWSAEFACPRDDGTPRRAGTSCEAGPSFLSLAWVVHQNQIS